MPNLLYVHAESETFHVVNFASVILMLDAKILPIKFQYCITRNYKQTSILFSVSNNKILLFQDFLSISKEADLRCSYPSIAVDIYGELVNIFGVTEKNSQRTQIRASGIDQANAIFSEMPL